MEFHFTALDSRILVSINSATKDRKECLNGLLVLKKSRSFLCKNTNSNKNLAIEPLRALALILI